MLRQVTCAFSSPIRLFSIGQGMVWAASYSLGTAGCWWSPELETHSKCVLHHGEAGFGIEMPCLHRPHQLNLSLLGRLAPGPISQTAPNLLLGVAFLKGKLSSGNKPQPQGIFLQEATRAFFSPSPLFSIGQRMVWAASYSLGTAGMLVVS